MLKKDVLLFLHDDWKQNLKRLKDEQVTPAGRTPAALERIAVADKWMNHYALQLLDLYGLKV